ncbi:unnamed protein product [Discosporangium mesarthrocarpum]
MINIKGRRCRQEGCKKRPGFAPQGETKGAFCAAHKLPGMVDVVSRRCQSLNCTRQPVFGWRGQRPTVCGTHKENGMFDVRGKRCTFNDCTRQPGFGDPKRDRGAVRCHEHKLEGMTNVRKRRAIERKQQQQQGLGQNKCFSPNPLPPEREPPEVVAAPVPVPVSAVTNISEVKCQSMPAAHATTAAADVTL